MNINSPGGYRGATWIFPTGLEMDEKVAVLKAQAARAAQDFAIEDLRVFVCGRPVPDPRDQWEATVAVQVVVAAPTEEAVSRFLTQFASYWLGSIPGFYLELPYIYANSPQPRIDYLAALVPQELLRHKVHLPNGDTLDIAPPPQSEVFTGQPVAPATPAARPGQFGPTARRPLGDVILARAGDKGAHANLGVWVSDPNAYPWLASYLTTPELRRFLNLTETVTVERYEQPLLNGVSFVLRNYFAPSGSANLALDQIGKSLGEFLLARHADIPVSFLAPPS